MLVMNYRGKIREKPVGFCCISVNYLRGEMIKYHIEEFMENIWEEIKRQDHIKI